MRQALALERKNAYAVLWVDIVERRAKQKGVLAGGKGLRDIEMKGWPAPVLLMFVGETKPEARARGGGRSERDREAGAHLRGEFLWRRSTR